jgi:hydroxypyruvate reductase
MKPVSNKPRLLQIGALPPGLTKELQALYELHALWQEPDRARFLANLPPEHFAGAVTMSRHGCDADVFARIQNKVLACFGVGFDRIDLEAARRFNVAVSTTPDVLTDCVADLAFGLILATARQIIGANRFVQEGRWIHGAFPLSNRVSGKRLGIVGLGRIGATIAKRSSGFEMPVRYFGIRPKADVPYEFEPDLHALAQWADFLVIACPGGPATQHLISASVLQALGPQGFLINIARGSVIDEAALVAAIVNKTIAGAGLDVLTNEPHVPPELLQNDRVVILPHVAPSTHETRAQIERLVLDNLKAFFETGRILTPPG